MDVSGFSIQQDLSKTSKVDILVQPAGSLRLLSLQHEVVALPETKPNRECHHKTNIKGTRLAYPSQYLIVEPARI